MSLAERSGENPDNLGAELLELTAKAHQHSSTITEVTEQIQNLTQDSVMAMQFEDIVTQMMGRISQKMLDVGKYLHNFLQLHHDRDQHDGLQRFKIRIERLTLLLSERQANIHSQSAIKNEVETSVVDLF